MRVKRKWHCPSHYIDIADHLAERISSLYLQPPFPSPLPILSSLQTLINSLRTTRQETRMFACVLRGRKQLLYFVAVSPICLHKSYLLSILFMRLGDVFTTKLYNSQNEIWCAWYMYILVWGAELFFDLIFPLAL